MFRGYVLRYLARIGTAAPGVAVPHGSWIARLARAYVLAARFETERADDEPHVHRLAYLRAIGSPAIDPNDVEAVRRTFESKRNRGAEDRAMLRLITTLGAALAVIAIGIGGWLAYRTATRVVPPIGAPPATDPLALLAPAPPPEHPLTALFRDHIPDYDVALDARSAGRERAAPHDVAATRAQVLAESTERFAPLVPSITRLLDASEAFSSGTIESDEWQNTLTLFHDALEAENVPFYVDAQLLQSSNGRRRVLMSTYRVLARRTFASGERRIRALDLERLDSLNHAQSLLGYTRPEGRYALVLVDRIERFLVGQQLPSMHGVEESVFVRGYEDETGIEWVTEFEQHAHEDLRAEGRRAAARAGASDASLDALASSIVRRRRAILDMSYALRDRGVELIEPRTYIYDVERLASYRDDSTGPWLREVRLAQRELDDAAMVSVYRALLDAHTLSVAQHETQHRLDFEDGRLAHVPAALAEYTGETESEDRVNNRAERANAELSAYLSQVAHQPEQARTELIHVASFLMARDAWGTAETYAAIVLFEVMAQEAGIEHGPLIASRRIQRAEVAHIYAGLRQRGGAGIAALASAAWANLYGGELAEITPVAR